MWTIILRYVVDKQTYGEKRLSYVRYIPLLGRKNYKYKGSKWLRHREVITPNLLIFKLYEIRNVFSLVSLSGCVFHARVVSMIGFYNVNGRIGVLSK